ncbi:2-oxoacid:acceptor oxidoreductase family protein [Pseudodesulfovibrio thermohalotolerans]|jgi:2-oxoglutarate ferredoxin oxidoreductase subunit gamma|uniref:2-oxoacid:acceptor oxidoreductase family protein n=1 Tax=Pseudodesulfovibrio thermohalotolerans TaxID=2880651 RepID=UPI0024434566|nr:2-oxoacid:acceptor oxidoreductase family protein [Pseudodesulfovibrio thermohalotolerans]WFS62588.1 2-oxoacid:acceptor oxidoreductase family protein [Pseudodesulfovibrio thermohalotolerans]
MRYIDSIIAGFGGQGVMLIGNLLAYAGMKDGLNVTYIPVYGPEMRGGTANCTVVLSQEDIGSPIILRPKSLIAMNRPSLDKFQSRVQDGGIHIINSSLIDMELADTERLKCYDVPCNEIADELGNTRMANMVAIGAFVQASGIIPLDAVIGSLENVISPRYHKLIPANAKAIEAGAKHVA